LSTTSTAASHVGGSSIMVAWAVGAHSTSRCVWSSVTVCTVRLTITADNKPKAYGAALPTLTASYAGFVNGDTAASLTTAPALSRTAASRVGKGGSSSRAAGADDADYTISYGEGQLTGGEVDLT